MDSNSTNDDTTNIPNDMISTTTTTATNDQEAQQQQQSSHLHPTPQQATPTDSSNIAVIYTTPPSGIGSIPTDLECLVSMEDITEENYVEYQIYPTMEWKSSLLSQPIIEELLQTQFQSYMDRIQSSDCQAELKRLLQQGPPIYISDPYGLPVIDSASTTITTSPETAPSETHNTNDDFSSLPQQPPPNYYVMNLWYASDQKVHSSILHNAVVGEAHEKLWKELQSYLITTTNTDSTGTTNTEN